MQLAFSNISAAIPICGVVFVSCTIMLGCNAAADKDSPQEMKRCNLQESRLPDLPDPIGLAGPFAGVSNGALIVAGGTNFPDKMPWEGGVKTWHDAAYILESKNGAWKSGYRLRRPLAYGLSLNSKDGVLCIGGNDSHHVVADVSLMQWESGQLLYHKLPDLPTPVGGACGAVIGDTVYVAGGYTTVNNIDRESQHSFWSLDLSRRGSSWKVLDPWPGPGRFFAVAGATDDSFYIFSGMCQRPGGSEKPRLGFLTDCYRYSPAGPGGRGEWTRIADLPRAYAAAPGPAAFLKHRWLVIVGGGADESVLSHRMQDVPEFPKVLTAYDTLKNTWQTVGTITQARVATPLVSWGSQFVVSSGEIRSGVRTPEVWAYEW